MNKDILKNKRFLYFGMLSIIVLFCIILNATFSAFTQSTTKQAANMIVNELSYTILPNGNSDYVLLTSNHYIDYYNVQLESNNSFNTKYEITYEVCSDKNCTSTIAKPANFEIYYSSKTQDRISDTIESNGNKIIRIVVVNDSDNDYYYRLGVNSGYAHNALTLIGNIHDVFDENDLIVKTYINDTLNEDFPTTENYETFVECTDRLGNPRSTTGTVTWDGSKWVLSVTNLTETQTYCNVYFEIKYKLQINYINTSTNSPITDPYIGYYLYGERYNVPTPTFTGYNCTPLVVTSTMGRGTVIHNVNCFPTDGDGLDL